MASIVYTSLAHDLCRSKINFDATANPSDLFKMMLLNSSYTPDKDHSRRSNVVAFEVVGQGYVAGGKQIIPVLQNVDTANDDVEISFQAVIWPQSTITARYGVVYKARQQTPDKPEEDELIGCVDFLNDISSNNDSFIAEVTSPLKFQN